MGSHCGLLTRKRIKRPVTVALPYPPPLHQNEGKQQKKNRNRKRFSCFFNNTTKGRTFQFLMTISNARSPTLPPSSTLRMNVNKPPLLYEMKKNYYYPAHQPP